MSKERDVTCEWSAWYNRQPGRDDPNLHVVGHCKLRSGSIKVGLEPGNEGIVDDPKLYVLACTVDVPPGGTDDYVERDVSWERDVGQDIESVDIRGDLADRIDVEIIQ
jgi:hypothetical protein